MKKTMMLALATMILAGTTMTPNRSEAFLIITGGKQGGIGSNESMLLCLLVLPLCLLNEKIEGTSVTAQDLKDNGYSAQEISEIALGQALVTEAIEKKELTLSQEAWKNGKALGHALRTQLPQVPAAYVEFVENN